MAANDPPMTTGRDLAIALRAAYLALHRRSDARFAPHGVTADQFVLLATLARGGDALTQRELARRMSSDPSTVRAMLVLLAAARAGRAGHAPDRRPRPDGRPHGEGPAGVPAALEGGRVDPGADARRAPARRGGNARPAPGAGRRGAGPGVRADRRTDFLSPLKRMNHERTHRGPARVGRAGRLDRAGPGPEGRQGGEVPRAARGLRRQARRHRPRQAGDGRVRLDDGRREAQGAGLHAAGVLQGQEVPGPVPPARHRRRRERVDAGRRARRDPRQPVRRQEGGADDRRHAQRPGVEGRDGDGTRSPSSRRRSPRSRRTCSPT